MADEAKTDDLLCFNGVNGATGDYGLPPMTGEKLSQLLQGEAPPEELDELRGRHQQKGQRYFGVKEGVDPKKLDEAGWGVIFAHDAEPAIKEALAPLLELRREQAGDRYRCYQSGEGFQVGKDTKGVWLARHGVGPGPADPDRVPYYLLIAGSPEKMPYRFQSQLDVQYATGRICFDRAEEYARYAESVVAAESGRVALPRRMSFFGVENDGDAATGLSSRNLVAPLRDYLQAKHESWQVDAFVKDEATKANLARLLGGEATPALVFTASHGMEFPSGDPRQIPHQGALLCQDWPGPRAWRGQGAVPQDFYFAGDDIGRDAGLLGLIGFHFACYGAGTPHLDEFAKQAFKGRAAIAPHAFLAALPSKMLSHPRGGALAAVGHVERAWGYSFTWQGAGAQTAVFESTLDRLLDGHPVGSAIEYFNERYAELSTVLAAQLEDIEFGASADPSELAGMWTANNDARGYMVLGDPAVRMPVVEPGGEAKERPVIEIKPAAVSPAEPRQGAGAGSGAFAGGTPAPQTQTDEEPPEPAAEPAGAVIEAETLEDDLPFALGLIEETEARHRTLEVSAVSFGVSADAPPALRNRRSLVEKRLARLGLSAEDARRAAASVSPSATSFAIPSQDLPPEAVVGLERIMGRNEMIGATYLELGAARAKTVGRILIKSSPTRRRGFGTGFLVAPGLLMTNNHVLKAAEAAKFSQLELGYQEGPDGKLQVPATFNFDSESLFVTDQALDFSLVAVDQRSVDGEHQLSEFGWCPLSGEEGEILTGEYVNIIQHPNGEPKQLAARENQVTGFAERVFLHYQTDTAPGSSGSPVFNDQWVVVALHHSGVPNRNDEGQILSIDGQVWHRQMGEHRIDWLANEGIRIGAILDFLGKQDLPVELSRPLLEGQVPATSQPAAAESAPAPRPGVKLQSALAVEPTAATPRTAVVLQSAPAAEPAVPAEGGVTWTIPLQVTVKLDPAQVAVMAPAVASVEQPAAAPVEQPATATVEQPAAKTKAISIDPDYTRRKGYRADFLGETWNVALPELSEAMKTRAAVNQQAASGGDPYVLPYHNYSVVMNRKRKQAFYAAVNIDGKRYRKTKRAPSDRWFYDPRIGRHEQAGPGIYTKNPLDRGHLVRRLDAAWGDSDEIARVGSDDTFHYTNCSPQHKDLNRNRETWAGLENHILKNAGQESLKVSVFNGPVLDEGDPPYRGVNLPIQFWKVVVMVKSGGELSATAYLLSQDALVQGLEEEFAFGEYKTFQVPVRKIEALTGLDFHHLRDHDPLAGDPAAGLESTEQLEVGTLEDLVL